jgi:hypothetical protein
MRSVLKTPPVRQLVPVLLASALLLAGPTACKTDGTTEDSSEVLSSASPASSDKFTTVTGNKYDQLKLEPNAEFFGCLCVGDQTQWEAWKFLRVSSKGYKAPVAAGSFTDLEACVAVREQAATQCEG